MVAKHIYNQPNEAAWLQPDACHHHILQEATTEAARRTNSGLLDCQKKTTRDTKLEVGLRSNKLVSHTQLDAPSWVFGTPEAKNH
jgi:hypothetical protein